MSAYVKILIINLLCVHIIHTLNSKNLSSFLKNKDFVLDDVDIKTDCAVRKCLRKCCLKNQYLVEINEHFLCKDYENKKNIFSTIPIYDDDSRDKMLDITFRDTFFLIPGLHNETISFNGQDFLFSKNSYRATGVLMKSGAYYLDFKNSYSRWTLIEHFCVDYQINDETIPTFLIFNPVVEEPNGAPNTLLGTALIISSFFLFLVFLVYCLLPELRNLVGLILMAYDFSILGAFLFLFALQVIEEFEVAECIALTAITYFFFLATFCWMNVMSYDIWWTFRGYAKARPIHRRGEKVKFLMYCVYAWGVPLLMTIMLVVVNSLSSSFADMPWIVLPLIPQAGCFLEGGQKFVYLYIPMLILILCNWFFFLMTAFNIWRLSRATAIVNSDAAGNPNAHRSQRSRLMIYLKLSLIMGINWVLEVASFIKPDLYVWKFTDTYNLLIGFAIFLIFICKRKIYQQLRNRYFKKQFRKTNTSSSTFESNLSQETPLQICSHPMGLKTKSNN